MALSAFIPTERSADSRLVLANRREMTKPVVDILETLFETAPIEIVESDRPDLPTDQVVLERDGEVLRSTPMADIVDSVLMQDVQGGAAELASVVEADLPDVLDALADTTFRIEGRTASRIQTTLFLAMSRMVERLAARASDGTLRTGFQELSRMEDEHTTGDIYRALAAGPVDVHVYGAPDWDPDGHDLTVHPGTHADYLRNWFVVFTPGPASTDEGMAFLATQLDDSGWEGFWTRDPDLVEAIDSHIAANM